MSRKFKLKMTKNGFLGAALISREVGVSSFFIFQPGVCISFVVHSNDKKFYFGKYVEKMK